MPSTEKLHKIWIRPGNARKHNFWQHVPKLETINWHVYGSNGRRWVGVGGSGVLECVLLPEIFWATSTELERGQCARIRISATCARVWAAAAVEAEV
eukprot:438388-Pelagomonas_calceolata.AAC.1